MVGGIILDEFALTGRRRSGSATITYGRRPSVRGNFIFRLIPKKKASPQNQSTSLPVCTWPFRILLDTVKQLRSSLEQRSSKPEQTHAVPVKAGGHCLRPKPVLGRLEHSRHSSAIRCPNCRVS